MSIYKCPNCGAFFCPNCVEGSWECYACGQEYPHNWIPPKGAENTKVNKSPQSTLCEKKVIPEDLPYESNKLDSEDYG